MIGTVLVCSTKFPQLRIHEVKIMKRKVASTSPSHFEAHAGLFRLLMEGIFDAYVQRVPALRGFWDLKKTCYVKFALVGLHCSGSHTNVKIPQLHQFWNV